jgi:hypothetical protein
MPFGSFVGPDRLDGDVAGNGISKLFFTIISAVAEAERDRIVQRILDVRATSRRGRHLGGKRDATAGRSERRDGASARTRGSHPGRRGRRHRGRNDCTCSYSTASPACLRSTRSDKAARTFASCKPPFASSRSTAVAGSKSAIRCSSKHNWINFLDAAAKTEERAWLD